VPKTGVALIHKGERILSSSENASMGDMIGQLLAAMDKMGASNESMLTLWRRMTEGGSSLRTTAA